MKKLPRWKESRKAADTRISSPVEPAAGKSTHRPSRNDGIQRPLPTEATDVSNVSESPGDSDAQRVASVLTDIMTLAPISELWDEAYEKLSKKENALIVDYKARISAALGLSEGTLNGRAQRHEQMQAAIDKRIIDIEEGKWKLAFKGHELVVKDLVQPVVGIVDWAKTYVSTAVAASPPASLAWGGVCLLLPLVLNPSVQEASRLNGLDKISCIVSQCSMRESLYRRRFESSNADAGLPESKDLRVFYRNSLKDLYVEILNFQATTFVFLSGHTLSRTTKDIVEWNS